MERFSDAEAYHGEGPVWIGGLRFVDMLAGDFVALTWRGCRRSGRTPACG